MKKKLLIGITILLIVLVVVAAYRGYYEMRKLSNLEYASSILQEFDEQLANGEKVYFSLEITAKDYSSLQQLQQFGNEDAYFSISDEGNYESQTYVKDGIIYLTEDDWENQVVTYISDSFGSYKALNNEFIETMFIFEIEVDELFVDLLEIVSEAEYEYKDGVSKYTFVEYLISDEKKYDLIIEVDNDVKITISLDDESYVYFLSYSEVVPLDDVEFKEI